MSSAGLRLEGREKDGKVQLFDTRRWCLVITEEEYDREREIEREIVLHEGKAFTDRTVLCVWRNTGLRPCRFILESEQLDVHSDLALFIMMMIKILFMDIPTIDGNMRWVCESGVSVEC